MQDFRSVITDLWPKAVLARSTVEETAEALVLRVREGLSPEAAEELVAHVAVLLREHRRVVAEQVDGAVRRALRLPSRAELKDLGEKIDDLEARIAKLSGKENSPG